MFRHTVLKVSVPELTDGTRTSTDDRNTWILAAVIDENDWYN